MSAVTTTSDSDLTTAASIAYNAIVDLAIRRNVIPHADAAYWNNLEKGVQERIVRSARHVAANKVLGPDTLHARWVALKKKEGWTFGHDEDPEGKRSPLVRDWKALTDYDRVRMRLFVGIVTTMC